jgi:peroxiredoxin Q/BCP
VSLPKAGNNAPTFSLLNQKSQKAELKDLKGEKIAVLYFYPKAITLGFTTQACGLRDSKAKLTRAGAIVLGLRKNMVSGD